MAESWWDTIQRKLSGYGKTMPLVSKNNPGSLLINDFKTGKKKGVSTTAVKRPSTASSSRRQGGGAFDWAAKNYPPSGLNYAPTPQTSGEVGGSNISDLYAELQRMIGGQGGTPYPDPAGKAASIVNPKYDAQIAALNAAAANAQKNSTYGQAQVGADYQALGQGIQASGDKLQGQYDQSQVQMDQINNDALARINAAYEKAKGETAAQQQKFGIVGDAVTPYAQDQASAVANSTQTGQNYRQFSESNQQTDAALNPSLIAGSGLEGNARKADLVRQLQNTLAGYDAEKVVKEGERQSELQDYILKLEEANNSGGLSSSDNIALLKMAMDQGSVASTGSGATSGLSAASDILMNSQYGSGNGQLSPSGNNVLSFFRDTVLNDSGIRQGNFYVDEKDAAGMPVRKSYSMTPSQAQKIASNLAIKNGITDPYALNQLRLMTQAYYGKG